MGSGDTLSKIKVAVLMGGKSAEREVSLSTGKMILQALDPGKYESFPVDTAVFGHKAVGSGIKTLPTEGTQSSLDIPGKLLSLEVIAASNGSHPKPDVAFIALHGRFGEDGTVQGLLELLEIPYVGSGVLASALAMDKIMARRMMAYGGIPIPKGVETHRGDDVSEIASRVIAELGLPAVVKPNRQGSTIGLTIAHDADELPKSIELAFQFDEDVLIEEFVDGTEITVPVLGNRDLEALPIVEIVPEGGFYDYHAKYTAGATDEIVPARIPEDVYRRAQELGVKCHELLGCRGMSRTDMIIRGDDIYVLETNTIPGMTPTSLLPRSAQAAGIGFPALLDRLIALALEK